MKKTINQGEEDLVQKRKEQEEIREQSYIEEEYLKNSRVEMQERGKTRLGSCE